MTLALLRQVAAECVDVGLLLAALGALCISRGMKAWCWVLSMTLLGRVSGTRAA
jgi:hypothetical protein